VTRTGTGGVSELRDALDDSRASFAYARVTFSNDKESQREKFILVVWIGSGCKVMRKAKVRFNSKTCMYIHGWCHVSRRGKRAWLGVGALNAALHMITVTPRHAPSGTAIFVIISCAMRSCKTYLRLHKHIII